MAGLAAVAAPTTAKAGPLALCRAMNSSTCMEGARPLPRPQELLLPPVPGPGAPAGASAFPGTPSPGAPATAPTLAL